MIEHSFHIYKVMCNIMGYRERRTFSLVNYRRNHFWVTFTHLIFKTVTISLTLRTFAIWYFFALHECHEIILSLILFVHIHSCFFTFQFTNINFNVICNLFFVSFANFTTELFHIHLFRSHLYIQNYVQIILSVKLLS
jgi:hypothetical protein